MNGYVSTEFAVAAKREMGYSETKKQCENCKYVDSLTDQAGHDSPVCGYFPVGYLTVSPFGTCLKWEPK